MAQNINNSSFSEEDVDENSFTLNNEQSLFKIEVDNLLFNDFNINKIDKKQLDLDKQKLCSHPLFPILVLLFERCERFTHNLITENNDGLNSKISEFIEDRQRKNEPFLCEDSEVDTLMIRAIQVLRIHLMELEKVQELCKDFCARYKGCLKSIMHSENLLQGTINLNSQNEDFDLESYSDLSSENEDEYLSKMKLESKTKKNSSKKCFKTKKNEDFNEELDNNEEEMFTENLNDENYNEISKNNLSNILDNLRENSLNSNELKNFYEQMINLNVLQVNNSPDKPSTSDEKYSNKIENESLNKNEEIDQNEIKNFNENKVSLECSSMLNKINNLYNQNNKKSQKRGVLPKHATTVMRSWLFQHIVHPYPTEDEKKQIAAQTNLTLLQVSNWFINARRRILFKH